MARHCGWALFGNLVSGWVIFGIELQCGWALFGNLTPSLPSQLTTLELQYVSPKLMGCVNLELAVPGTYEPNQPVVHIRKVSATLNVITSKQRPRKLVIQGQ